VTVDDNCSSSSLGYAEVDVRDDEATTPKKEVFNELGSLDFISVTVPLKVPLMLAESFSR
jgi:hypothetical protein